MIEKMANGLADQLVEACLIEKERQEDYAYTYTCMAEKIITSGTILILSLVLKNFIPTIFFLTFFFTLRTRTGGYHADTFLKCYFGTIAVYLFTFFICNYVAVNRVSLAVLLGLSTVVIGVFGTLNNPAIHMNRHELNESKKSARAMLVLEDVLIVFFIVIRGEVIIIKYMSAAIILCATLMCFAKISEMFDRQEGEL